MKIKIKRNEEFAEGAEVYARVIYRQPLKLVTLGKKVSSVSIAWNDTYELWNCMMPVDWSETIKMSSIAIKPEDFEEDYKEINNVV